jgi:uncharacterized protein
MLSQGLGLMMKGPSSVNDTAWVFCFDKPRTIGVTMAFMRYPLDILFLNSQKKVIEIIHGIRPWSGYVSQNRCKYFVELRAGTAKKLGISLNDWLGF